MSNDVRSIVKLQTRDDIQLFMKAIFNRFLSDVDVLESGLLDALYANKVINETDYGSLRGAHLPTREDCARHLWNILGSIDSDIFISKALPILCEKYGYIIPAEYWGASVLQLQISGLSDGNFKRETIYRRDICTSCAIKRRIRPMSMTDFLYENDVITEEDYRRLVSNHRLNTPKWPTILEAFQRVPKTEVQKLQPEMKQLLLRHSLSVPNDLTDIMTQGFPCLCSSLISLTLPRSRNKVNLWKSYNTLRGTSRSKSRSSLSSVQGVFPAASSSQCAAGVTSGRNNSASNSSLELIDSEMVSLTRGACEASAEEMSALGVNSQQHIERTEIDLYTPEVVIDEDSVMTEILTLARHNSNLHDLRLFVELNVTSAVVLSRWLTRIKIIDREARKEIVRLIDKCSTMESICKANSKRFDDLTPLQKDDSAPPLTSLLYDVLKWTVCASFDLLLLQRVFVYCELYLCDSKHEPNDETRTNLRTISQHALVLLEADVLEVYQSLHNLPGEYDTKTSNTIPHGFLDLKQRVEQFLSKF